jgi:DNA-directed RNA polymerase subunit RPC12/RpoP
MAQVSCPKCGTLTSQGSWPVWVIVVAICFFPIGLLALLAGRNPAHCPNCGFTWKA